MKKRLSAIFAAAAFFFGASASAQQPDTCVRNSNAAEFQEQLPKFYESFEKMNRLPLTAKPLYKELKNSANDIHTCLLQGGFQGRGRVSTYTPETKEVAFYSDDDDSIRFHEYFHAGQDILGAANAGPWLSRRDAVVGDLLSEATAVAYELVVQQEAAYRGVPFKKRPPVVVTHVAGGTVTQEFYSASDTAGIKKIFQDAYGAAWNSGAGLDDEARLAKALSAGGKAAAKFLLEGNDPRWTEHYSRQAVDNVNAESWAEGISGDGYAQSRRYIYADLGKVSPRINLTPDILLGPDADQAIDDYYAAAFSAPRVPATPKRSGGFGI